MEATIAGHRLVFTDVQHPVVWRARCECRWIAEEFRRRKKQAVADHRDHLAAVVPDLYKPLVGVYAGQKQRKHVLARLFGWVCAYCARELDADTATVDHIIPRSRGGSNAFANTCLACRPCNQRKKDRLPDEIGMHPNQNPLPRWIGDTPPATPAVA